MAADELRRPPAPSSTPRWGTPPGTPIVRNGAAANRQPQVYDGPLLHSYTFARIYSLGYVQPIASAVGAMQLNPGSHGILRGSFAQNRSISSKTSDSLVMNKNSPPFNCRTVPRVISPRNRSMEACFQRIASVSRYACTFSSWVRT